MLMLLIQGFVFAQNNKDKPEIIDGSVNNAWAAILKEKIWKYSTNDRPEYAQKSVQLVRGQLASVNLIPYNPVEEKNFQRSKPEAIKAFALILETNHITVSIRKEMGKDIDAACGQLRFNSTKKEE